MSRARVCKMFLQLMAGEQTARAIIARTGNSKELTRDWLRTMHKSGVVHISEWDYLENSPIPVQIYKLGPGVDAPRPTSKAEFLGTSKRKKAAECKTTLALSNVFSGMARSAEIERASER